MPTRINKGFTLVELLISISIVSIIMTTILINYGTFSDTLSISAASQEMSIAVREAQTYGLTVKEVVPGGGNFNSAYGIYFNPTTDPSNYYIFADINSNNQYDIGSGCGSGNTECVKQIPIRNNVVMTSICDANSCPPSNAQALSIVFLRPNPDAQIYFINSSGQKIEGPTQTGKITLTSQKGKTSTVIIQDTGQVLVQ